MKLVIGGSYQGKLSWAVKEYGLKENEIQDLCLGDPEPGYRCYTHLEALTRRVEDCTIYRSLFENAVVISREVGCGVVPMDTDERLWRERHGVFIKSLAKEADSVTRLFCGIAEVLK